MSPVVRLVVLTMRTPCKECNKSAIDFLKSDRCQGKLTKTKETIKTKNGASNKRIKSKASSRVQEKKFQIINTNIKTVSCSPFCITAYGRGNHVTKSFPPFAFYRPTFKLNVGVFFPLCHCILSRTKLLIINDQAKAASTYRV